MPSAPSRGHQPPGEADPERDGDRAVEQGQAAVADHLDDRRGRADDRLDRARARRGWRARASAACASRPVEAEDVDAGEDEQAGQRHDQRGRDAAGEMVERRDLGAVGMGLGRGRAGPSTYWKAWRTMSGTVEILRAISNRPAAAAPRAPGSIRLSTTGGASIRARRGEVGGEQGEPGDEQVARERRPGSGRGPAASGRNSGRAAGRRARRSAPASRDARPSARCWPRRARKKPSANRMRAICSQKMRRRISGPKARRARAAEVATSTKVHKGSAQTNRAMAVGRRAASSGAAEKMRGDRVGVEA